MKLRYKLMTALGAALLLASPAAASAAPNAARTIEDGNGTVLSIQDNGHDFPVQTSSVGNTFQRIAVGSHFELKDLDGLCLTNNSGHENSVYMESCSGSIATQWSYNATTHVLASVQVVNSGHTGNLTAEADMCTSASFVGDEGGLPLECQDQWLIPS